MRTLLAGGQVFDPRSGSLSVADVVIEDGRIADVGSGLDGDRSVEVGGRALLPGLFDCHTHVMVSHFDLWKMAQTPFSLQFFEAAENLEATDLPVDLVATKAGFPTAAALRAHFRSSLRTTPTGYRSAFRVRED